MIRMRSMRGIFYIARRRRGGFRGVVQPAYDGIASYDLDDIRAIRFTNVWPQDTEIYEDTVLGDQIRYFGDYAVSMYFQESRDEGSGEKKSGPEQAEWEKSPKGTKAVYIVNEMIPNALSPIVVRYQENIPDLIFREQWEYCFADWIDEDHFICYNDFGPRLIHLETKEIQI